MTDLCPHEETEPVTLPFTGETVAHVCAACFASLPANWDCPDCEKVDLSVAESATPERIIARPCARHEGGGR